MNSDTYQKIRAFWSKRFGFDPASEREETIFRELAWVSVQNSKVLRQIERESKEPQ